MERGEGKGQVSAMTLRSLYPKTVLSLTFNSFFENASDVALGMSEELMYIFVQTFMVTRGRFQLTPQTFYFHHQQVTVFTYLVKYLNIYLMDFHR